MCRGKGLADPVTPNALDRVRLFDAGNQFCNGGWLITRWGKF